MNTITIIIADDHPVVRLGLRTLIEKENDFRIIAETADGLETVETVKRLKPNFLILDLMMPGMNGMDVTRLVRQYLPETRIIILSMHSSEAYVLETLKSGASGYVLKDTPGMNLILAIKEVLAGRRYISPPLSEEAVENYMKAVLPDPYQTLTNREREVLHFAAEGHSNTEIATRLSISPRTVEVHRANMMHKLGLKNQTELVRYAIQKGILLLKNQ